MTGDRACGDIAELPATPWREPADRLARALATRLDQGLSAAQARDRLARCGPNRVRSRRARSIPALMLDQFRDLMVLLLIGAALIAGLVGGLADAVAIIVILLINALIGFAQALRAQRAIAALSRIAAPSAEVMRDGLWHTLAADQLVPGDLVRLEAGAIVPADLRLIELAGLRVDESALTGESVGVDKTVASIGIAQETEIALADRLNMAYRGTTVSAGHARGLVVATGMRTEFGRIAAMLGAAAPGLTPLQRRLGRFGARLAAGVMLICLLILVAGLARGEALVPMLLTAISLAVAAVPEALPAVVTVLLALGARRMVARHALVRRLPAVETLGSVSVICSDKTGTLTRNRMQVEMLCVGARCWRAGDPPPTDDPRFMRLLRAMVLNNDTRIDPASGALGGDPTETAMIAAARALGVDPDATRRQSPRLAELGFDSERKRMSTVHPDAEQMLMLVKGAPESVLACCIDALAPDAPGGVRMLEAETVARAAEAMAAQGLRVLAFAQRRLAGGVAPGGPAPAIEDERELSLIGLVGLMDPPREGAAQAVAECIGAGIRPVMITGDHPATALALARRIGIVSRDETRVLSGARIDTMAPAQLQAAVRDTSVFARVDPAQKIRIVSALQALGEFVAMTGDGVNDAPALRQAEVGVAMGRGGTDVAREAADLVLLDDDFATIVVAVREGRRIFANIRKFVRYNLGGNLGEVLTIALAPMLGMPLPLLPVHILWVNLVTDGLPGITLAGEPAEDDLMRRAPLAAREQLFDARGWAAIGATGMLIALAALGAQAWAIARSPAAAQSMVFTVLTFAQMAQLLALRSETRPMWRLALRANPALLWAVGASIGLQLATLYVPALNPVFRTQPLSGLELGICAALALAVYAAIELAKGLWADSRGAQARTAREPV